MKKVDRLFQEFTRLERRRSTEGLSAFSYRRWRHLKEQLDRTLSRPLMKRGTVFEVRGLKYSASFHTPWDFGRARMQNITGGGIFVDTDFPAAIGTSVALRIWVESSRTQVDLEAEVVSQNVSHEFSTARLGMGLRFKQIQPDERKKLEKLLIEAKREKVRALDQRAKNMISSSECSRAIA